MKRNYKKAVITLYAIATLAMPLNSEAKNDAPKTTRPISWSTGGSIESRFKDFESLFKAFQDEHQKTNDTDERTAYHSFINRYEKKVRGTKLAGTSYKVWDYSKQNGIDPRLTAAIILLETGNGTSRLIRKQNNVGGLTNPGGQGFRYFASVDKSISFLCSLLNKHYIKKGLTTVEEMNLKYSTSATWSSKVRRIMKGLY